MKKYFTSLFSVLILFGVLFAPVNVDAKTEVVKKAQGLSVTQLDSSYTVSWKKAPGATKYKVQLYEKNGSHWNRVLTKKTTSKKITFSSLESGQYRFRVQGVGKKTEGAYSKWKTFTVSLDEIEVVPVVVPVAVTPVAVVVVNPVVSEDVVFAEPVAPIVSGVIKKSVNDICHEPGGTYYNRTIHYTPYNTIEDCLSSGGRLPLR